MRPLYGEIDVLRKILRQRRFLKWDNEYTLCFRINVIYLDMYEKLLSRWREINNLYIQAIKKIKGF